MTSKVHPLQGAHALLAIAFSLAAMSLTGCGGGSGVEVQGRVLPATGDTSWTVCVDLNRDFACDDAEAKARTDSSGNYRLALPRDVSPDEVLLLAERREDAQRSWLAAPASAASMGVFSTLVALQWEVDPDAGLQAAQRPLRELFGLGEHIDLLDADRWSSDASLQSTARALYEAWQAGGTALAQVGNQSTGGALAPDTGELQSLALTLRRTAARYLDPESRRLLPGVTARTLAWEVAQTVQPSRCVTTAPATMQIDTDDAAPIVTKADYVKGTLRIQAPDAAQSTVLRLSIRGRGNATWALPKKPYRLKLDQASSLLGLPAERDWAMLANYLDKSMLRNALAFCMGRQLGLDYTPASRFVELRLNGAYQGLYELTEHVKVGPQRVDIGTVSATEHDPGGFLLEIDVRLDEDFWFYGGSSLNMPYTVKSDADGERTVLIKSVIDDFEERLFGVDFADPEVGYAARLDVEALVDYYLINELVRNNDIFFSSTFVHRKDRGKLVFGPLWDFDVAAGNINPAGHESPEAWWARDTGYMPRLFEDPAFARQVAARWSFLSSRMPALLDFIRESAAVLDSAQARNFAIWRIGEEPGWPHNRPLAGSYAGEIDYLTTWLQRRAAWLDTQFDAVARASEAGLAMR